MTSSPSGSRPNPVDRHVGARIRYRRKALGLSQTKLGEDLGITFQQVQKYERGANRVSASKLYEMARLLSVPISYFFGDLAGSAPGGPEDDETQGLLVREFLMEPQGSELAAAYLRITSPKLRGQLVALALALAADAESGLNGPSETEPQTARH